jgi:putative membrane protein
MALATLGAIVTIALTLAVNASLRRDLARELAESLRVKHPDPLGEEAIERLLRQDQQPAEDAPTGSRPRVRTGA